jgi:hypothetical protein
MLPRLSLVEDRSTLAHEASERESVILILDIVAVLASTSAVRVALVRTSILPSSRWKSNDSFSLLMRCSVSSPLLQITSARTAVISSFFVGLSVEIVIVLSLCVKCVSECECRVEISQRVADESRCKCT